MLGCYVPRAVTGLEGAGGRVGGTRGGVGGGAVGVSAGEEIGEGMGSHTCGLKRKNYSKSSNDQREQW